MSQTKHEIESLLAGAGTQPRHRFGQNFMIDRNIVRLVADAGEIAAGDLVIEVGPGTGTLTEELLDRAHVFWPSKLTATWRPCCGIASGVRRISS